MRVLTYRPLANGTTPDEPNCKSQAEVVNLVLTTRIDANIAPFFLNETFPENWYRRGTAYSLADLAVEVLQMFLYAPKPFGQNQNGVFAPLELQVPTAPQDVQCFLFAAFLDLVPDQLAPEFNTVNDFVTKIVQPFFGGDCNLTAFASDQGSNDNTDLYQY